MHLDPVSLRVLGSLMEKEMATPELYPLSLNSLLAACNQRSSRDPVFDLSEEEVRSALSRLEDLEMVTVAREGRVPRFEHRIRTVLNLRRDETAVLCLLLLRGPQTAGELRGRSDRLFPFDDVAQAQATLDRLAARPEPLTAALPKAPGSREPRFLHLLGDPAAVPAAVQAGGDAGTPDGDLRDLVAGLTARVHSMEERLRRLEASGAAGHEESQG